MATEETAPDWVIHEVLPALEGPVRSVQMLNDKSAIVLGTKAAVVAEKGKLSGLKLYRVEYPSGFFVNGADCPHCHQPVQEPVAKVARLAASDVPAQTSELTEAERTQREYAAKMKGVRSRAAQTKGGKGPIKDRAAAKELRKELGVGQKTGGKGPTKKKSSSKKSTKKKSPKK